MVVQYPNKILIHSKTSNSTQNEQGDWVVPQEEVPAPVELPCRIELRSSAGYITSTDGKLIEFQSIIYLPLPMPDVSIDQTISVKNGEVIRFVGTVKQFSKGQLNARIWI